MRSLIVIFIAILPGISGADPRLEFFEKEVRPVLVKHCYECHSHEAKKAKGGLYLDSRQGWELGGDSGPAVVPGKPRESLLVKAVNRSGIVPEMPPKEQLSKEIVGVLERWIADGAADPRESDLVHREQEGIDLEKGRQFWAFLPRKVENPDASIDGFIRPAAPPAAPGKLLRRLYYDLIGLPPSRSERISFLSDFEREPEQAVVRLVDDLLSRPGFGEKWARHWLDLARYADSNGGDINLTYKEAWRYRNYVIDAFNGDMPYDRFLREQLAGDLMPWETREQRNRQLVATGFLLVGPKMLSERNKAKMHLDIADEQLDTVGRAVLGLTMGCARCHDHKFDPVPTKDYYAMAGIFHSSATASGIRMNNVNVSGWHERPLEVSPEDQKRLDAFAAAGKELDRAIEEQKKEIAKWKRQDGGGALPGVVVDDADATVVGNWRKSTFRPDYIGAGYLSTDKKDLDNTYIVWRAKLPKPGKYEVRLGCGFGNGIEDEVPLMIEHDGGETRMILNQRKPGEIDDFWHVLGTYSFTRGGGAVTLYARGTTEYVLADAVQFIHEDEEKSGAVSPERKALSEARERLKALEKERDERRKNAPPRPMAMAAEDKSGEGFGDLAVRIRGEVNNLGPVVSRGFLQVVSFPGDDGLTVNGPQSGRLELAEWLTHPGHPLTSRVMVNRIWQQLFGRGIVRSSDNFGTLGDTPSHPELLDWLAEELVGNGWSLKHLIRTVVLSQTYRQAAAAPGESDPENRKWHHQNRRPLTAEAIRDSMLVIAGKLDRSPVGSAVADLGDQAISNSAKQSGPEEKIDENRHRSIYLPMVRNAMPKVLEVFDMANPDMVTGKRPSTTVPAQALYLMNAPFVREMASETARDILGETGEGLDAAVNEMYLRVFSRAPEAAELVLAREFTEALVREEKVSREEALASFCQTLFSTTEFRFLE